MRKITSLENGRHLKDNTKYEVNMMCFYVHNKLVLLVNGEFQCTRSSVGCGRSQSRQNLLVVWEKWVQSKLTISSGLPPFLLFSRSALVLQNSRLHHCWQLID